MQTNTSLAILFHARSLATALNKLMPTGRDNSRGHRSSLYTNVHITRHTRREAGIQCHGW
jgi:hypothetical protein